MGQGTGMGAYTENHLYIVYTNHRISKNGGRGGWGVCIEIGAYSEMGAYSGLYSTANASY